LPDLTDEWKAELALKFRKSHRLNRERRAEARSSAAQLKRRSPHAVKKLKEKLLGMGILTGAI